MERRYVYKNDLTGHWMLDTSPKREGNRTTTEPRRQGFRTVEAAWIEAAFLVDTYCAERRAFEANRAAIIARDRKRYPWLYEDEGDE